jgi:hypothetical protein
MSESWLADKIGGEMGFMMGGSSITGSSDTLVSAVLDTAGQMLAFATWSDFASAATWRSAWGSPRWPTWAGRIPRPIRALLRKPLALIFADRVRGV